MRQFLTETEIAKRDSLIKSQKEIDAMTEEQLAELNEQVNGYTTEILRRLARHVYDNYNILTYAYKRYKELRTQKIDKHPMWRSKGTVELVLMETGFKITKFSTGFEIHLGDIDKDLCYLKIYFDKTNDIHTERWYRNYKKTVVLSPEEKAALMKKRVEEQKAKDKKQFEANWKKLGLRKTYFGKTFETDGANYTVVGCYPRNKKMPYKCIVHHKEDTSKDGTYYVAISIIHNAKEVDTTKETDK